jgi:transcriptional repressor NrdR
MNDLSAENLKEIPTRMIGPKVMARLKDIDPVAFVRYASVYRQFQDVGEFNDVIESLEKAPLSSLLQPDLFES